jgi:hypothetical protein
VRLGYLNDVNKRPGHIKVTVETGYCSFCDRTRNLRREERQLGALVRTVVSCESCHRLLSSTIGVADAKATATEMPAQETAQDTAPDSTIETEGKAKPKAAGAKPKAAAAKPKAAGAKPKAAAAKPRAAAAKPRVAAAKSTTPAKRNRPTK